jgi:hypothetical protein
MFISGVVTHRFWYSCFMAGVHKHVGQIRKPDKELTVKVFQAMKQILDIKWRNATATTQKQKIAEMGMFIRLTRLLIRAWFIGGFCMGLRGEEMILLELAGTANSFVNMNNAKDAHLLTVILGRTKGFNYLCNPLRSASHGRDPSETWTFGSAASGCAAFHWEEVWMTVC